MIKQALLLVRWRQGRASRPARSARLPLRSTHRFPGGCCTAPLCSPAREKSQHRIKKEALCAAPLPYGRAAAAGRQHLPQPQPRLLQLTHRTTESPTEYCSRGNAGQDQLGVCHRRGVWQAPCRWAAARPPAATASRRSSLCRGMASWLQADTGPGRRTLWLCSSAAALWSRHRTSSALISGLKRLMTLTSDAT